MVKVKIYNISTSEIFLRGLNNLGHITKTSTLVIPFSLLESTYLPKIDHVISIRANIEGIANNYRVTKIYKIEYPLPGFELGLKVIGEHMTYYIFEIIDYKRTEALNGHRGYSLKNKVGNLNFGIIYDFVGELESRSKSIFEGNILDWEIVSLSSIKQRMAIAYIGDLPNLVDLPHVSNKQNNDIIDESGTKLSNTIRYLLPAGNYFNIINSLSLVGANSNVLNIGTPSSSGYIYTTEQILRIYNELSVYNVLKSSDVQQI